MILLVTEIQSLAKGQSEAVSCQVQIISTPDASELEANIAKLILSKIREGQDLLSKASTESVTLEGKDAIKDFGPAATSRMIKAVK
jgi:hypothetical protein